MGNGAQSKRTQWNRNSTFHHNPHTTRACRKSSFEDKIKFLSDSFNYYGHLSMISAYRLYRAHQNLWAYQTAYAYKSTSTRASVCSRIRVSRHSHAGVFWCPSRSAVSLAVTAVTMVESSSLERRANKAWRNSCTRKATLDRRTCYQHTFITYCTRAIKQ